MYLYCDLYKPAAHALLLFFPHPSRLHLNATEMSVTFTGYMWTVVPSCAQKSALLLQCHLWFGAVRQRPLSQELCVSWVRLAWNSTVPDGRIQRPRGRCEASDETWYSLLLPLSFTVLYQWHSQGALHKARRLNILENDTASTPNVLGIPLFHSQILEMH